MTQEEQELSASINQNISTFLRYEIASSPWARWVWWGWGQNLVEKYYLRKVIRKYARFLDNAASLAQHEKNLVA